MKLLLLNPRVPAPPSDGGAQYVYHIAEALAAAGHQLDMIAFGSRRHPQDPAMMQSFLNLHSDALPSWKYGILPVAQSFLTGIPAQVIRFAPSKLMQHLLSRITQEPDAVLLEGLHSGVWLPLVRTRFAGVPVILRTSNVEWELLYRRSQRERGLFAAFWRHQAIQMKYFETRILKACDGVTAISALDISKLSELAPGKPYCEVPAGFRLPGGFVRNPSKGDILFVADFTWHANRLGLDWFRKRVVPLLQDLDVTVIVAGRGLNLQNEAHGQLRIHYAGFVTDLRSLQASATVQVIAVEGGGGVKLRSIEALSLGLPVVMNSFAAEGIPVTSGQEAFVGRNAEEMAGQIRHIISNPEAAGKMGEKAAEFARKRYSWDRSAADLTDFIQSLPKRDDRLI